MASKTISSWSKLEEYLKKQIAESLAMEVAEEVKDVMTESGGVIEKEVYDKYTPYSTDGKTPHYIRTYELQNKDNIESKMIDDSTLSIRSIRNEDGRDIAEIIETSKGYSWGYTRDLDEEIGPRPFHEKTKEELERTGRHVKALKSGLKKRLGKNSVV